MARSRLVVLFAFLSTVAPAQWLNYSTPGTPRTACACSGVNPEVETAWRAGVTGVTGGSGESVVLAAGAGPSAVPVTPGEELGGR